MSNPDPNASSHFMAFLVNADGVRANVAMMAFAPYVSLIDASAAAHHRFGRDRFVILDPDMVQHYASDVRDDTREQV